MTDFRTHLDSLRAADDLVEIGDRAHWADTAAAVAGEAARENGPAVLLGNTGGTARLVSGALGGPDRLAVRSREPWSRVGAALDLGLEADYLDVLDALVAARRGGPTPDTAPASATETGVDVRSLGLPAIDGADVPVVTLGLAAIPAASADDGPDADDSAGPTVEQTHWLPVRGSIHGSDTLRLSVPSDPVQHVTGDTPITILLGAPPAALVGATMRWVGDSHVAGAPHVASALGSISVAATPAGAVPAASEVVVEATVGDDPPTVGADQRATSGRVTDDQPTSETGPAGPRAPWEDAVATTTFEARVETVRNREEPLIPFSPTGAPMADGRTLLSIIESARLYGRVNNYWGVAPVEWLALPAEAGLGICLVASEILYAGFEWQLANTLFSFSRLFDKVVVLDTETAPMDLGRAFDDIWVKAHPANDWEFSDSEAPAATATHYRRDGSTGANVYVNAAWDPRWDEEYIAPRVTFETTYPEDLREAVRTDWMDLGFDNGPEHEPGHTERADDPREN
ncbi:UbiD family decarboxylase domain-containing protein [Halobellus sp. H-GB7]|uniref:UbiD family decarboxylase domain-containing protein n=1 Tax=Halobellus sp. H-GB7 TaxID=3069756 RepID=UPI0027B669AA|nr:UbiD family decarboxylase domain-containing protein [Halobellus sp. H-GB7]MDQ2056214.1 UbiD family decarboxylase [Halobellus sp. H-GB7]